MSDLREKRIELILQQLEELPTLPAVATRVLEVTARDGSSADEVAKLISSDPSLTARILKLLHRADTGARANITSIDRAVVLLGFETVRNAVLALSVFETFNAAGSESGTAFNREEFWKHCIAVACCAELLATAGSQTSLVDRNAGSTAFICGLLHDLGKIALDTMLPKSYARVVEAAEMLRGNIADVERSVIGLDHMVVGKRLAERWHLPAIIRDVAWLHGQLPRALPANIQQPRVIALVALADDLVREQHLGYSGNFSFLRPRAELLEAAGVSEEDVQAVLRQLVEHVEPRAQAMGLGKVTSAELYQKALASANRELGHAAGQLEQKNKRLAVRARYFDAMSGFQGELRPDAESATVLRAVAQAAVGVLGVSCAAAFSLPINREYAEVLICDESGGVVDTSLVDLPPAGKTDVDSADSRVPTPPVGDGPVMAVGNNLEWLCTVVSPRLPHERRYWICLLADNVCIGGVLWGAPEGEASRLASQVKELCAIANGWALALRAAQVREESRAMSEQLAEANRQLHNAQAEILRSRTMISVGEMAAGAAHEMNNPLAVISGRSQLLATQLTDPKFKAAAHLIHEQSHRISAIITELMDFARPEAPKIESAEIADVLERALHEAKMQADPADRSIELTIGETPAVSLDAKQVSAAICEVLENAIHATDPQKGQIGIHAGFDPFSHRVVVTISDDGCGMDDNTVKHAFDPFFSNKPAGRRRGMGLAKALRWIEASGGSIRLESRPAQGTRIVVLLAAADASASGATPPQRKAENF
jgi:signal transduction histidine kinase/HD-like signal output (HDOD) protein